MTTETEQGIFEQVLHGDLDFTTDPWPSISEGAKDLVRRMLVRDPRRRLTAHEVLRKSFCLFAFNWFTIMILGSIRSQVEFFHFLFIKEEKKLTNKCYDPIPTSVVY